MRSEVSKQKDGTTVSETIADKETGLAPWQSEPPRLRYARLFLLVVIMLSSMFVTTKSYAAARFGTRCQSDYQNSWQVLLPYQWKRCAGFNNELDDTDTKVFYFNLQGSAKSRFSTCDSCGTGVDDVHLFYVGTHGGALGTDAALAMWTKSVLAASNTDKWRFGDGGSQCAFFAQYACKTLKLDGKQVNRWLNTFRGGLIMALGSHDTLFDGLTTDETGEDFADGLQKSKKVKWAWFDGNSDWYCDQDVAVFATGSNLTGARNAEADCTYRRDNVKWQNFGSYAKWRDDQISWMCWAYIDD
jgi:hypothetical protein